ncbi:MAG: hypothetical protein SFY81_12105 [Verrucomicrobiota bacterium]|nr:hypothetical protein [Verrucomicrobiota bacterium]
MTSLYQLIKQLEIHEVSFVIVGGFAGVLYGSPLITEDLDICISFEQDSLNRLWNALKTLHPVHRMTPQKIPLDEEQIKSGTLKNLYLRTDLGTLDCLSEIAGLGDFQAVLQKSEKRLVEDTSFHVLTREGLILSKKAMNRLKDRATILFLESQGRVQENL